MVNPKEGASVLSRCAPRDGLPIFVAYFKNTVTQQVRSAENLCLDGWMGGWVADDILGPSIFLEYRYSNKRDVLIPNMASKVV